jgi:hypothetical protein
MVLRKHHHVVVDDVEGSSQLARVAHSGQVTDLRAMSPQEIGTRAYLPDARGRGFR